MQSGTVYQGVLRAISPKLSIALALSHDKSKELSWSNTERLIQLNFADIVTISALPESNPNLNNKGKLRLREEGREVWFCGGKGFFYFLPPLTYIKALVHAFIVCKMILSHL